MFRAYLYKLTHSPLTYIGFLGVFALCFTNFLSGWSANGSIIQRVDNFLDLDVYRKAITIFAALPFTSNFADEWKSNITNYCLTRRGIKKYTASNILLCAVISIVTVFVGMILFVLVLSPFIPFHRPSQNTHIFPYGELLDNGPQWLYITARIFIFSCSCSVWCVMGLMLSAFLPNKYVAICSPLVASYVVERITIQFPAEFNLWPLSLSNAMIKNSTFTFIYTLTLFALISAVCGVIFYVVLRKRVQNEIT